MIDESKSASNPASGRAGAAQPTGRLAAPSGSTSRRLPFGLHLLQPAPLQPRVPAAQVPGLYRRLRLQVFVGIFLGYASYYLVRNNLALAIPSILKEHPEYTKAMLGTALTGLSLAYGLSKFLMGSVSDRSNPRYFLPLGLLLSCVIMAASGMFKALYASFALIIILQFINGWVQGMGWPPCGKTMVHWWSTKERGLTVSLWNVAHNVGGGLVAWFATLGVAWFNDWGATFYFNALIAAVVAFLVWGLMRDTPQSCGLPPIEEYRQDYPPGYSADHERTFTFKEIFFGHVLNNGALWAIAVANAFVYFVRYGVVNWIPTYLETQKGFSFKDSSVGWLLFEFAAIPGTIVCGWVSDKVFKGRRAPATILFMALTLVGVLVYWGNLHGPRWIDYAALTAIGFLIYGPVMLIGLHALDLVPKKAAGTAAGFTGFFGYVFGSAIAGTGVGWIADKFGWRGVFISMVACCVLTMVCSAVTLFQKPKAA
ncbi:phosphoglycerate transporter protein PgtP [Opitutus sp. ER46]|uniref:phosphoglycerate transporter protein PgtP n=1 Tax=Opitutus sp. ER46 TaxID=2161864 RepID=UPI000D305748|nr:phosphoglycerate transporter protein PgtP [Opitutus sp. ER46]PTX97677.1 glycerol-3-phosphate transporter [Opitutus sp. ER46]